MEAADEGEPGAPEEHLVHVLDVHHAEHEDELVEDVVPELVLDALRLRDPQPPEHQPLDAKAEHGEEAVRYVYHRLGTKSI